MGSRPPPRRPPAPSPLPPSSSPPPPTTSRIISLTNTRANANPRPPSSATRPTLIRKNPAPSPSPAVTRRPPPVWKRRSPPPTSDSRSDPKPDAKKPAIDRDGRPDPDPTLSPLGAKKPPSDDNQSPSDAVLPPAVSAVTDTNVGAVGTLPSDIVDKKQETANPSDEPSAMDVEESEDDNKETPNPNPSFLRKPPAPSPSTFPRRSPPVWKRRSTPPSDSRPDPKPEAKKPPIEPDPVPEAKKPPTTGRDENQPAQNADLSLLTSTDADAATTPPPDAEKEATTADPLEEPSAIDLEETADDDRTRDDEDKAFELVMAEATSLMRASTEWISEALASLRKDIAAAAESVEGSALVRLLDVHAEVMESADQRLEVIAEVVIGIESIVEQSEEKQVEVPANLAAR